MPQQLSPTPVSHETAPTALRVIAVNSPSTAQKPRASADPAFIDWAFSSQVPLGICTGALCLVLYIITLKRAKKELDIVHSSPFVAVVGGGYLIPQYLLLIWCAFRPQDLEKLSGIELTILFAAVSGLLLTYLNLRGAIREAAKPNSPSP